MPFPILDRNILVDIIVPSLSFSTFLGIHTLVGDTKATLGPSCEEYCDPLSPGEP